MTHAVGAPLAALSREPLDFRCGDRQSMDGGMTTAVPAPPPGWYQDPTAAAQLRYFDGVGWTEHTAPQLPTPPMAYGQPPVANMAGAHPNDVVHWLLPTGRTWQSIVAGYVALFALVIWILGPVALYFGLWALYASARGGGHGRGRAIFAVVVGVLSTIWAVLFLLGPM